MQFSYLLEKIAAYYNLSVKDIMGPSRKQKIVKAREVLVYFAREKMKMSYPAIGFKIGNRNHTTALHAYFKIIQNIKTGGDLKEDVEFFSAAFNFQTRDENDSNKHNANKEEKTIPIFKNEESLKAITEKIKNIKIENLKHLSTRTINVLEAGKIVNLNDLLKNTEMELKVLEGMGDKGIKEIKKSLGYFGVTLDRDEYKLDTNYLSGVYESLIKVEEKRVNESENNDKVGHIENKKNSVIAKKKRIENLRHKEILLRWDAGLTLEEIGKIFNITRERVRQIVAREIRYEADNFIKDGVEIGLDDFIKLRKQKHAQVRDKSQNKEENNIKKQPKKWSPHYDSCRKCYTNYIKHQSHGYCRICYPKTELFKQIQKKSRLRNIEKRKKYERKYLKEYNKRPEVIERYKKEWDIKNFGGNREKVLKRDGYRCQVCGITQEESYIKHKKDLFVNHRENLNDNKMENLITVCKDCHNKKILKIARAVLRGNNLTELNNS